MRYILIALIFVFSAHSEDLSKTENPIGFVVKNEEQFLVASTIENLVKLTGKGNLENLEIIELPNKVFPSYVIHFNLKEKHYSEELNFPEYIFDPKSYQTLTDKLFLDVKKMTEESQHFAILEQSMDLKNRKLQALNVSVSDALKGNPFNSSLHEDAALLLSIFAWKEAAGKFYDVRETLCKVSARLAVAAALRPKTQNESLNAKIALIISDVLLGREVAAELKIATTWPKPLQNSFEKSWKRGIQIRNKYAWNLIEDFKTVSTLEKLELFRAQIVRLGNDEAVNNMKTEIYSSDSVKPHTAYLRILNTQTSQSGRPSVSDGHYLSQVALLAECFEIKEIFESSVNPFSLEESMHMAIEALMQNREDHEDLLISDTMWSEFFERHILNQSVAILNFMRFSWGALEVANQFSNKMISALEPLPLFTLVHAKFIPHSDSDRTKYTEDGKKRCEEASLKAFKFIRENEEKVVARTWRYYYYPSKNSDSKNKQKLKEWFHRGFPYGTTYNCFNRFLHSTYHKPWSKSLSNYHKLAPNQPWFSNKILIANKKRIKSFEQGEKLFGEMLAFDKQGLNNVASALILRNAENDALRVYQQLSIYDSRAFKSIAKIHLLRNREKKALEAYEKYHENNPNTVSKANYSEWLMHQYFLQGKIEEARKVADFAGKVYSYHGLETMIEFYVHQGNFDAAVDYANKVKLRYNDDRSLINLYARFHDQYKFEDKLRIKHDGVFKEIFPEGFQEIDLISLGNKKPERGLIMTGSSSILALSNLNINKDIIVGIDGYKVNNVKQYSYIRKLKRNGTLTLLVWQKGKYVELQFNLIKRLFDSKSVDFFQKKK